MKTVVYAVGQFYYIMWNTQSDSLGWVIVNGRPYYEENAGILLSETVHRVKVPQKELDSAKEYTIHSEPMQTRSAYFSQTKEAQTDTVPFRPVEKKKALRIYMLADTHSVIDTAVQAAGYFKDELDLLILNGDIMDTSEDIGAWNVFFDLSYEVTKGQIPIVSARGNHDTRGPFAPYLGKYCPNENGDFYYTFRLGDLWGVVLDCGEDKTDAHPEYAGTVQFQSYRERETRFLEQVAEEKAWGDAAWRIAVCHIQPNISTNEHDKEVYDKWMALLNEMEINIMFCGHDHKFEVIPQGDTCFNGTQVQFPMVIGAKASGNPNTEHKEEEKDYVGTAAQFGRDDIKIYFTDCAYRVREEHHFAV